MDVLGLTNSDQIRQVMGVTSNDLSDSDITSFDAVTELQAELQDWVPTYQAIIDNTGHTLSSADRDYALLHLKLFSKYWVAAQILVSGQNFILQRQSDGDNEGHRFTNANLMELRETLHGTAEKHQERIVKKLQDTSTVVVTPFSVVTPSYDPVTN